MESENFVRGPAGYEITVDLGDGRFRLTVPDSMLDEECGADADEAQRQAWIAAHLPGVMTAFQSRNGGGWEKAPYNRILVEELD